jgi:hypothetical protein
VGGIASAFIREYLNSGRECFVGANIHNQSKSLSGNKYNDDKLKRSKTL